MCCVVLYVIVLHCHTGNSQLRNINHTDIYQLLFSFTVNDGNRPNCFLCVLMLCTCYYDVVTAVCPLLINEYVMLLRAPFNDNLSAKYR